MENGRLKKKETPKKDYVRFDPKGRNMKIGMTVFWKPEAEGNISVYVPSLDLGFMASSEEEISKKFDLHYTFMMAYYTEKMGGISSFLSFLYNKGFRSSNSPKTTYLNVLKGKNNRPAKLTVRIDESDPALAGYSASQKELQYAIAS